MSNNHVEIIGFHLGNETTSLAKIKGDDPYPRNLLLHKTDCQPTMIAYHPEQGVLFGKPASDPKATDFQKCFKKRPTSDPNYQTVMRDYVNAIYDHLLETNQLQKDDQNHFFISCPSEWSDPEKAEYQKLLESSNLPRVTVIKESFAVLMQARASDLLTGEEIKGNVLVIDFGSSTTDCTLVKAGIHEEDGDFGIDLGAGLIDKAILDYSLSQNEDRKDIESFFQKFPYFRHSCEFKCRQAKEEYFCIPDNYQDSESKVDGSLKIQKIGIFEPIVYKQIIKNVTEQPLNNCLPKSKDILPSLTGVDLQKSWQDNFRYFLMETKQKLEKKGVKVNTIILTGGASKMDFIPEIVHQVFPNCKCTRDTEPGLCIAMGLARYGEKINQDMIHIGIGAISGGAAGNLAGPVGMVVGAGVGLVSNLIPHNDNSQKNQDIKKVAEVTMNNKKLEIIGFDLGHGETALSKILGDNPQPKQLLLHQQSCQPTMIAYSTEQGVLFGKPALNPKVTDFQIAFKKRPTSDPNYQKVMVDYVNAIYQHLVQTNQLQKDDQNHFFIGCPSEWTDAEIAEYQKLFKSSHLPEVSIIEESFAAMMQARMSDLVTGEEIKGNVLVIDVGSSTTDCTLVKAGIREKDGDFGIDLGAGLIDKAILDYSLSQNEDQEDIESVFPKFPYFRHSCEFKCRQAKEEYFCIPDNYQDSESKVDGSLKIQKIGIFEPIVYKQIIKNVTEQPLNNCLPKSKHILPSLKGVNLQKSWQDNFRIFLMETKQRLEKKGVKVNTIVLTGGASKMNFIPEFIHQIFPNCKCLKDTEPGLCIAMGLARWGKRNINTIHFTNEVEQFLQNDLPKIFTDKVDSLRSKLTENLVDGLSYKVIKPTLLDWRNRSYSIDTIHDLESTIISRVKTWLEGTEGKNVIKKAINSWVNDDLVPPIKQKTDPICDKYGLKLNQLVPSSLTYNPNAGKLSSENLNLADPTVMTSIVNWIIGVVVTVITLALATTGIGLIIGFFVAIFGMGYAEEIIKDSNIPKFMRRWVSDEKISEMTSGLKMTLKGKVEEAIAEDPTFMDKILNPVKDWLSQLVREQANSVKILIS